MLSQLEFDALLEIIRRLALTQIEAVALNAILEKIKPQDAKPPADDAKA